MKKFKFSGSILLISALMLNMIHAGHYDCEETNECSTVIMSCCEKEAKAAECCCLDKPAETPKNESTSQAIPALENNVKNILFFSNGPSEQPIENHSSAFKIYTSGLLHTSLNGNKVYKTTHSYLI